METQDFELDFSAEIVMVTQAVQDQKGKSVIRGWRGKEFLLVDTPKYDIKIPVESYVKTVWTIRYSHEGRVVGFKVKGLNALTFLNLLVLSYPEKVVIHSIRRNLRVGMNMPVRLYTGSDPDLDYRYKGMTLDLSASGMRVQTMKEIKLPAAYMATVYLPTGVALKDVKCEVTRIEQGKNGCELGIKFCGLATGYKKAIDACFIQLYGVNGAETDSLESANLEE